MSLSYGQTAILLCLGLQMRDISCISEAIDLPLNQALALFSKAVSLFLPVLDAVVFLKIRKMHTLLKKAETGPPSEPRTFKHTHSRMTGEKTEVLCKYSTQRVD